MTKGERVYEEEEEEERRKIQGDNWGRREENPEKSPV
jgi:hypothetical protein